MKFYKLYQVTSENMDHFLIQKEETNQRLKWKLFSGNSRNYVLNERWSQKYDSSLNMFIAKGFKVDYIGIYSTMNDLFDMVDMQRLLGTIENSFIEIQ